LLTAQQYKLSNVLGDEFVHEIPPYQRPYAWTAIEAEELFEDLCNASAGGGQEYFLGSIILIKKKDEKSAQVVDGQQRLTTLTILAAVLRDAAESADEQQALAEAVFIEPNIYKRQAEAVRILPHPQDRAFFRQAVQPNV